MVEEDEQKVLDYKSNVIQMTWLMGVWFGIVTIAIIIIFVVIYKRLGRSNKAPTGQAADDAETGDVDVTKKNSSSIIDVASTIFPTLSPHSGTYPEKTMPQDTDVNLTMDNALTEQKRRPSEPPSAVHDSQR